MKFSIKKSLTAIALAAMIFGGTSLYSQNLVNQSTGTIHIYSGGQVVLNDDAGEFQNAAVIGNIVNDGKIVLKGTTNVFTDLTSDQNGTSALGVSDAMRVPGTVEYSGAANTQAVPAARYFTNLVIDNTGGTITFPSASNTWLSGSYTKTNGTTDFSGNTFYFDGDTGEDQTLAFTESFNNLVFSQAGVKTIDPAGVITVGGTFDIAATTTGVTTINGALNLGTGVGTIATAAGNVILNDAAARLNLGSGKVTFNNTSGLTLTNGQVNVDNSGAGAELEIADGVTFNVNGANGELHVTGTNTLRLIGDLTTTIPVGSRDKFFFACTSYEIYASSTADQVIMAVDQAHPYGNLQSLNANKYVENNIYLCSDLTVTGGILDVYTDYANPTGTAKNYKLILDGGATANNVTFTNPTDEVRGIVSRTHTLATGVPYTYNNQGTIITFSTYTPTAGDRFDVSSVSGVDPYNYNGSTSIHRQILLDYVNAQPMEWTTSVGFPDSDIPGTNGYPISSVRFYEGDNTPNKEKMSTGNPYTRTDGTAPALNIVSLPGFANTTSIIDGTADATFKANNELAILFGPSVFISVNNGRWSNPNTWDEGVQPGPDDEVIIRTTVHTGYVRAVDNYGPANAKSGMATTQYSEGQWLTDNFGYNGTDPMQIASKITIDNIAGSSLLLGEGNDGAVTYAIKELPAITNSGMFYNNNTNTTSLALTGNNEGVGTSSTYDGLYIMKSSSAFNVLNMENSGLVGLVGKINIGN